MSYDKVCRAIVDRIGAFVVVVDYRLVFEHKFFVVVDDVLVVACWVLANATFFGGDLCAVVVGGDSVGGNLVVVVAQLICADAVCPVFQLLVYFVTDLTRSYLLHTYFAEGLFLTRVSINWFLGCYICTSVDECDLCGSSLLVDDLAGLLSVLVQTVGFDSLRDEGRVYVEWLCAAGVFVEHWCYEGLIYGFFSMSAAVDVAVRAVDDAVVALRVVFDRVQSSSVA